MNLLVSRCLLDGGVRYDGEDKRAPLAGPLRGLFTCVLMCPEVEAGMPVPRPPIDLVYVGARVRVLSRDRTQDHTAALVAAVDARLDGLSPLVGAVLKARSPSCGRGTTRRLSFDGELLDEAGDGVLVQRLKARCPELPLADEATLEAAASRRAFLLAVARRAGASLTVVERWLGAWDEATV